MANATDVGAMGKLTLFGRTIVRLMGTDMSDRTLCRKKDRVLQRRWRQLVRLALGHPRMPRTGAQDEAHRLTSDIELSLGACVCFSILQSQVCYFCCSIELSIQRGNLCSSDAPTGVVTSTPISPSYQPIARHDDDDANLHTLLAHLPGSSRRRKLQHVNQLLVLW